MTAYVISEVEVLDDELSLRYRELAYASIARHGGRYIARAQVPDVVEGNWPPTRRLVIVEFPSMEGAQEWYHSPAYAEARAISREAHSRRLLFIDGVPES